ncbi:YcjF family protein [Tepidamorphus sp. 3E244]|uniref:YcjF family protein n=1 Tax=Tepidamorphus sp. 3E244 TaxID=3385498 RepID=UPI0038FC23F9
MTRKPTAFRLDDPDVLVDGDAPHKASKKPATGAKAYAKPKATITADTELDEMLSPDETGTAIVPAPPPVKSGFPWGKIFGAAISTFVSISFGLWATQVVEDLFARAPWLGWIGAGLLALMALALVSFVLKEVFGILRLSRIAEIRDRADAAAIADDMSEAKKIVARLQLLYAADATTAKGRSALAEHEDEIIDGRDRLKLAERHLLALKDAEARALVTGASKRVAAVTAISPRAAIDIVYVLWEAVRLIRRLATLYGGRPSGLGTVKLARMVVGHLALTGGVAMTDSIVQQLVGHGLAAKLSARLGEGVVNGLLTARIGLAALSVVRPLPYLAGKPPALSDIMSELTKFGAVTKKE